MPCALRGVQAPPTPARSLSPDYRIEDAAGQGRGDVLLSTRPA